jgi:hypothetical protein
MKKEDVIFDAINQISTYKCSYARKKNTLSIYNYAYLVKIEFIDENEVIITKKWKFGLIGRVLLKKSYNDMNSFYSFIIKMITENEIRIQELVLD